MTPYLLAFGWGLCILLALIGWGTILNRILFPEQPIDWGQRAAFGVAFSIAIGGILNVTYIISKPIILGYLLVGFLYFFIAQNQSINSNINLLNSFLKKRRTNKLLIFGFLIVILLTFLNYASWVATNEFNTLDDYNAYFVFPNKMLQTGSIGPEPFSERRMTSLGGQSFLHTLVLVILSEKNLFIIDPGIASIIVIGLILGYFNEKKLSLHIALLICTFYLLFPAPILNSTSLVIALALLFSTFRILTWKGLRENHFLLNAFILALTTSSICALKTNLIPVSGILLLTSYGFYLSRAENRRTAIYELLATIGFGFLLLSPWMISMYQSSGTLLFPLFGKGYHASAYDINFYDDKNTLTLSIFWRSLSDLIGWELRIYSFVLFCLTVLGVRSQPHTERQAYVSLAIATWLATLLVAIALRDGDWKYLYRYTFSFTFLLLVVSMMLLLPKVRIGKQGKIAHSATSRLMAIFLVGVLVGHVWHGVEKEFGTWRKNIGFGRRDLSLTRLSPSVVEQYAALQQAIPPEESLLARLEAPFLLDFRRNKILTVGMPGSASPPPGMPLEAADALASYLMAQSIRYVAYSYCDDVSFSISKFREFLRTGNSDEFTWLEAEIKLSIAFQEKLVELSHTRKRIYDDGEIFILDLLTPAKRT